MNAFPWAERSLPSAVRSNRNQDDWIKKNLCPCRRSQAKMAKCMLDYLHSRAALACISRSSSSSSFTSNSDGHIPWHVNDCLSFLSEAKFFRVLMIIGQLLCNHANLVNAPLPCCVVLSCLSFFFCFFWLSKEAVFFAIYIRYCFLCSCTSPIKLFSIRWISCWATNKQSSERLAPLLYLVRVWHCALCFCVRRLDLIVDE